jgi:hypothetical protein
MDDSVDRSYELAIFDRNSGTPGTGPEPIVAFSIRPDKITQKWGAGPETPFAEGTERENYRCGALAEMASRWLLAASSSHATSTMQAELDAQKTTTIADFARWNSSPTAVTPKMFFDDLQIHLDPAHGNGYVLSFKVAGTEQMFRGTFTDSALGTITDDDLKKDHIIAKLVSIHDSVGGNAGSFVAELARDATAVDRAEYEKDGVRIEARGNILEWKTPKDVDQKAIKRLEYSANDVVPQRVFSDIATRSLSSGPGTASEVIMASFPWGTTDFSLDVNDPAPGTSGSPYATMKVSFSTGMGTTGANQYKVELVDPSHRFSKDNDTIVFAAASVPAASAASRHVQNLRDAFDGDVSLGAPVSSKVIAALGDCIGAAESMKVSMLVESDRFMELSKTASGTTTLKVHDNYGNVLCEATIDSTRCRDILNAAVPALRTPASNDPKVELALLRYFESNPTHIGELKIHGSDRDRLLVMTNTTGPGGPSYQSELKCGDTVVRWADNAPIIAGRAEIENLSVALGAGKSNGELLKAADAAFAGAPITQISVGGADVVTSDPRGVGIDFGGLKTVIKAVPTGGTTGLTAAQVGAVLGRDILEGFSEGTAEGFHRKIVDGAIGKLAANTGDKLTIRVPSGTSANEISVSRVTGNKARIDLDSSHGAGERIIGHYTLEPQAGRGFPANDVKKQVLLAYDAARSGGGIDSLVTELATSTARTSGIDLTVNRSTGQFALTDGRPYSLTVTTVSGRVEAEYDSPAHAGVPDVNKVEQRLTMREALQELKFQKLPLRPDSGVTEADIDELFKNRGGTLNPDPSYAPNGYRSIEVKFEDDGTLVLKLNGGSQRLRVAQTEVSALRDALKKEICRRSYGNPDEGLGALLDFAANPGVLEIKLETTMASVDANGYERIVEVSRKNANSAMEITMHRVDGNTQNSRACVFSGQLNANQLTGNNPRQKDVIQDLLNSANYAKNRNDSFSCDAKMVSVLCNHHFILHQADLVIKAGKVGGKQLYGDTFVQIERAKGSDVSTLKISHAGRDIDNAAAGEEFRGLTARGEYAQLAQAFTRQGDNKLCIYEIRNSETDKTFTNIVERIAKQGESGPDRESVSKMLSSITANTKGFQNQKGGEFKIHQIWFTRGAPPPNQNSNLQSGRMVKDEQVYIIPDDKEFQIFINGDLDKDRWGFDNNGQDYKVSDLFRKNSSLKTALGIEGEFAPDAQGNFDERKAGFIFAMSGVESDEKKTFNRLFQTVNESDEEGSLEREMLFRNCTPLRYVMGIENNLIFDSASPDADPSVPVKDRKQLIGDIGLIEYRMHGKGELGCNLIPIGYKPKHVQGSLIGRANTIADPAVSGRIHDKIIRLYKPGMRDAGGEALRYIKNTVNTVADLNARIEQKGPGIGNKIYEALMPAVFQLTEEKLCVGKNVHGHYRQGANYLTQGTEIENVTIKEVNVGSSSYFEAILDVRVDPPANGANTGQTTQIRMRNEKGLSFYEFRKAIFDEIEMDQDKKLARLMSRMVGQGFVFEEVGEGANVRIHNSITKPELVRHSLSLLSTPEGADRLKGSFFMYNNEMDFVRVNLDQQNTGSVQGKRIYRHHFEANTDLINQSYAKKPHSYISFQQAHTDPAMAIYDGFSVFVANTSDPAGNRAGGSNRGGYPRRQMCAADATPLSHRMMSAINEGLELEARNAIFWLNTGGVNAKDLDFKKIDVKDSIVAVSYVGVANPNRPKPEFFNKFLAAFCDPYKAYGGMSSVDLKNNSVDVDLEAVPANFWLSNHRIDNLDFKTGKDGNDLYGLCLSNMKIDRCRIGHGGNLNECTGLNVTGCEINRFHLNVNGGAGFDSSNRLYGNHIGIISLAASSYSCDLRGTSFNAIKFKGVDLNRLMNWDERIKILPLIQVKWSKNMFHPTADQLQTRRNMRLMSDPLKSWWEDHFNYRRSHEWSNVSRERVGAVTDDMHKRTAKRDDNDKSKYMFGLNPITNDYDLKLRLTQDDTSKVYRWGMFGDGVRPDRIYVELDTLPQGWCADLPDRFAVNADCVLRDLGTLGNAMRDYAEDNSLAPQVKPEVEAIINGWRAHGYGAMYKGSHGPSVQASNNIVGFNRRPVAGPVGAGTP